MLWNLVAPGYPPIGLNTAAYSFVNSEAAALVARFATQPTDARKRLIDTLIGSLKTGGVWSKLDALYVMAAADSQAARQNWIADQYNLTAVSGPTFAADRGYTGDGAASYLSTAFNPVTAVTPKFVQDSASLGVWSRTNLPNGAGVSAEIGSGNSYIGRSASISTNAAGRPNAASGVINTPGAFPGHVCWSRTAAAVWEGYAQGVDADGGVTSSAAPANAVMRLCAAVGIGFGVNQLSAAHIGQGLSAAEVLAAYNALNTYLTAVGAA